MCEIVDKAGSIPAKAVNELVFVPSADLVAKTVRRIADGRQVFAVTDGNVARLHADILPEENVFVLPAGEDSKTFAQAEKICRAMLQAGLTRKSVVVAFGGGVVGDLAGFAASIYMRGIEFVNVPTTLLSQVDSAIGGKTGVNLDGYKNMLGSFKMPSHIVICPELLSTLPSREWRCGMGELLKTAVLDEELYLFVQKNIRALVSRDAIVTAKAVTAAANFKKQVTDEDPTEKGRRMILNLGHTVGHALEKCDNHRLSHGEYVLLGLAVELRMAGTSPECEESLRKLLKTVELPALPVVDARDVCTAAKSDKKNSDGKITLLGAMGAGKIFVCKCGAAEFTQKYIATVDSLVREGGLCYVG